MNIEMNSYINMLRVTKGVNIGDRVIKLCERYIKHGLLGISIKEIVDYYIYYVNVREEEALDLVDTLNKYVVAFKDEEEIYTEYRQKATEIIRIMAKHTGFIVGGDNSDIKRASGILNEISVLILQAVGDYNKENSTLRLLGRAYNDIWYIMFYKEYGSSLGFTCSGIRYTLRYYHGSKKFKVICHGLDCEVEYDYGETS